MPRGDGPSVAVIGAGPVGLEAALYARKLGLAVTVYERGRVGDFMQRWGHVRLFSPFAMNVTPLGRSAILAENPEHEFPADAACITGREHLAAYLEPLAKTKLLRESIRRETQVLAVGRRGFLKGEGIGDPRRGQQPFRLLLRDSKGRERAEEAAVVLDCSGVYGQHRWMGAAGIPASGETAAAGWIAYHLEDVCGERRNAYAGKNILLVGAGHSAATTACNLAALAEQNPETWVTWLARGPSFQPVRRVANDPLRERDRVAGRANHLATRGEGNIEFRPDSIVESIETAGPDRGFRVTARSGGRPRTWDVDRVIAHVGYTPDTALYRELQVHECYASLGPLGLARTLLKQSSVDCLQVTSGGAEALRNPEPNFYILGAKSYGRHPAFLLRTGFEQVRDVFTLIMSQPDLDLYKVGR